MKILSWNIRGVNAPSKQRMVRELRIRVELDLILLQETKLEQLRENEVLNKVWRRGERRTSVGVAGSGGLVSLWNPKKWRGYELCKSEHFITIGLVSLLTNKEYWITNVYAPTSVEGRRRLWASLVEIHKDWGGPWLVAGDFNSPLSPDEKKGGQSGWTSSMTDLGAFLQTGGLMDVPLGGARFTWSNRRIGHNHIQCRLDRMLINYDWACHFEGVRMEALPKCGSDHSPLILEGSIPESFKGAPFRFELMWLKHTELREKIQDWWSIQVQGCAMYRFSKKLNWIKRRIKVWNREVFENIFETKGVLLGELKEIENRIQTEGRSLELGNQELSTSRKLEKVLEREEIFWKQKSREQWLREGDRNTKFFHLSTMRHRTYNKITKI